MLECSGRFLGYVESSRTGKDGTKVYWTRLLDVNTSRGVETVSFSEDAWALLHGTIEKLVQYESELAIAVVPTVGSEYVQFQQVARVILDVVDFEVLSGPGAPAKRPAATVPA